MRTWSHPLFLTIAGVLAVLAATGLTVGVNGCSSLSSTAGGAGPGSTVSPSSGGLPSSPKPYRGLCEQLLVPAYFTAPYWEAAIHSKHPPADMILNVDGEGAGKAPVASLQFLVKKAQAAGITVLGYSSTADGQRPVADIETDAREYAAWYGVTSLFLDRVAGNAQEFSYYKQISDYVHGAAPGGQVWMNPGVYPDQNYMSIGDVVMVFEGSYAQYLAGRVPNWAQSYAPGRFSYTVYATPGAVMSNALDLAQQRGAGHVYVTDLVGSNPYQGLPNYWATEDSTATAGCSGSG
jgi:Spherulation-specific family 4